MRVRVVHLVRCVDARYGMTWHTRRQATAVEEKELKVTLQSLACGKVRVLRKEPKGRDVENDDVFFFESGFKHQVSSPRQNKA